ncbi:MAG: class I SAM-dependent methyltransferase [Bdellovibrionales bacterium]
MQGIQPKSELEDFYKTDDPWGYDAHPDDARRKRELQAVLPQVPFKRTLDIGCGNGFVTIDLPGDEVLGTDISDKAIEYARQRAQQQKPDKNIKYEAVSFFNMTPEKYGQFDLIVITGVLYPQYIGDASSLARLVIDNLLAPGGHLVSCHIMDWAPPGFTYNLLDRTLYTYRDYTHLLEVYRK